MYELCKADTVVQIQQNIKIATLEEAVAELYNCIQLAYVLINGKKIKNFDLSLMKFIFSFEMMMNDWILSKEVCSMGLSKNFKNHRKNSKRP